MLLSFFYQQSHPRVNHEAFVVTFFVMVIAAAAYLAKVTNMGDATFAGRKALRWLGGDGWCLVGLVFTQA